MLFPYTPRFLEQVITETAKQADIRKKVTPGLLRDMFVVRSVKGGMKLEDALERIGLSKNSYDYARAVWVACEGGAVEWLLQSMTCIGYSLKRHGAIM